MQLVQAFPQLVPSVGMVLPVGWLHFLALFEPCSLLHLLEIEEMAPFTPKVLTANQEHRVACTAPRGIPPPQVWWERNQERVPATGRVYQEAEQLIFTSITETDAGTYTCHAANKAGEKKQELNIIVASRQLSEKGWEETVGLEEGQLG